MALSNDEIYRRLEDIKGTAQGISRNIQDLKLSEGDTGAQALAGSRLAQSAGDSTPSMKFGQILMNMLVKAQQSVRPNIESLQKRQSELQGVQSERIGETPESLIGASPELQRSVRNASVSAVEPSIQGTGNRIQTLSQQLAMVNDVISQGRLIAQYMADEEKTSRKEKIDLFTQNPGAIQNLPDKEKSQWAKSMGVSNEFIDNYVAPKKAPEREQIGNQLFERDSTTGQWKLVLTGKDTSGQEKPLGATEFNIKAGILGLTSGQVADIVNMPNPPQWFADRMKQEVGAPLLPGLLIDAWQKAKEKIKSTINPEESDRTP